MSIENETKALVKCVKLIDKLDDEAKLRVIKYLVDKFKIGIPKQETASYQAPSYEGEIKQLETNKEEVEETDYEEISVESYPTLRDLMIKDYPKSEAEWILCYAFYASNYGEETFTKDDIVSGYKENNKYKGSARSNFTNNLKNCVKKDWIKSVNESDFILKDEGKNYAVQVINGNSTTKERKYTSRKKKEE